MLKKLTHLPLTIRLAILTVPPLMVIAVLGFVHLSGYYSEYRQLSRVRDLVVLANQFSAIGGSITDETNAGMWELIFTKVNHSEARYNDNLRLFDAAVAKTEGLLADAKVRWAKIDREGLDPVTAARIEESFQKAEGLKLWRRTVVSRGEDIDSSITNNPFYADKLKRNLEQMPERARRTGLVGLRQRKKAYTELSEHFGMALLFTSRVTSDGEMARHIVFQSELLKYHLTSERENSLIYYFIKDLRPAQGLAAGRHPRWLRSLLWDREKILYDNLLVLATDEERQFLDARIDLKNFPLIVHAREWLAANGQNTDCHKLHTPELQEQAEKGRIEAEGRALGELRDKLLALTADRIAEKAHALTAQAVAHRCPGAAVCQYRRLVLREHHPRPALGHRHPRAGRRPPRQRLAQHCRDKFQPVRTRFRPGRRHRGDVRHRGGNHRHVEITRRVPRQHSQTGALQPDQRRAVGGIHGRNEPRHHRYRGFEQRNAEGDQDDSRPRHADRFARPQRRHRGGTGWRRRRRFRRGGRPGQAVLAESSSQAARSNEVFVETAKIATRNGSELSEKTSACLSQMEKESRQSASMVAEILQRDTEQQHGLEQITSATHSIEQKTSQLAASAEEMAAAGHELSNNTEGLDHLVEQLSHLLGGRHVDRARAHFPSPSPRGHPGGPAARNHLQTGEVKT